jgi:Spy/CpxP family protein refolding chaperone
MVDAGSFMADKSSPEAPPRTLDSQGGWGNREGNQEAKQDSELQTRKQRARFRALGQGAWCGVMEREPQLWGSALVS